MTNFDFHSVNMIVKMRAMGYLESRAVECDPEASELLKEQAHDEQQHIERLAQNDPKDQGAYMTVVGHALSVALNEFDEAGGQEGDRLSDEENIGIYCRAVAIINDEAPDESEED